jgi:GntR family transcriptional regulator
MTSRSEGGDVFDDGTPIFQQLADRIAGDVLSGTYAEGDQVASTNEFAAFYRINPATAGKAVNLLVDRGVLYKRRGIGMFVAEGARERLVEQRRAAFAAEYVRPLVLEAAALGIDVAHLRRMIDQETAS